MIAILRRIPAFAAVKASMQLLIGSLFLSLLAGFSIPLGFTPIPLTLQTLGVSWLAIVLGPKKAAAAVLCYLAQCSLGLPVLNGWKSNPAWFFGPTAGYLVGMVLAAFLIGSLLDKKRTFPWALFSVALGHALLLTLGGLWLGVFIGIEGVWMLGILPFLPTAVIKTVLAATAVKIPFSMK